MRRNYLEEEAKRLEKEEDMWCIHEARTKEVEQERRHLADLLCEHEQRRAEADAELDEFRRGSAPGERDMVFDADVGVVSVKVNRHKKIVEILGIVCRSRIEITCFV